MDKLDNFIAEFRIMSNKIEQQEKETKLVQQQLNKIKKEHTEKKKEIEILKKTKQF